MTFIWVIAHQDKTHLSMRKELIFSSIDKNLDEKQRVWQTYRQIEEQSKWRREYSKRIQNIIKIDSWNRQTDI